MPQYPPTVLPAFSRKSRACKKLSEKLRFSSMLWRVGDNLLLKLLKQKIDLLQFSSKLELRGLFFISLPTAVTPTRKQNLNYKLFCSSKAPSLFSAPFYCQSGGNTTLVAFWGDGLYWTYYPLTKKRQRQEFCCYHNKPFYCQSGGFTTLGKIVCDGLYFGTAHCKLFC